MIKDIVNKVKSMVSKNTSNIKKIQGIDISAYQGDSINWSKVSQSDIKFVILRSTTKNGELDTHFWKNYNAAKLFGYTPDVYHFSYALSTEKAIVDAENLIDKLNGETPVIWLDLEWSEQGELGKDKVTEIATAFVKTCVSLGYECNIYSNLNWYKNYYHADKLKALGCKFWIARYGINDGNLDEKYKPNVGEYIWQYTSRGKVSGINGNVDMNMKYETSTEPEIATIQKLVKVICTSINIRTSPDSSISTNKVGYYKNGDIVEVIGITKNSWYKDANGHYFSANRKYTADLTGTVYNCYHLNMRDSNSTKGKVVTVLDANDKLSLLKESNGWYYAKTANGTKGYVSGKYVKPD